MELSGWERLLRLWNSEFYTSFFVFSCLLFTLIVGLKNYKKNRLYNFFYIYVISAFLLLSFNQFIFTGLLNLQGTTIVICIETINLIFAFIEYVVFYIFFSAILNSNTAQILMKFFTYLFTVITIVFLIRICDPGISKHLTRRFVDMAISLELLFIAYLCVTYFYELLNRNPIINLLQSPSFWIISGLFFYCILIPPFFLVSEILIIENIVIYHIFFAIHYISFGCLFLTIAKAFSCKSLLTT